MSDDLWSRPNPRQKIRMSGVLNIAQAYPPMVEIAKGTLS
jgi:hypothetical protein